MDDARHGQWAVLIENSSAEDLELVRKMITEQLGRVRKATANEELGTPQADDDA